nr:hypothetical protein [Tanacetum cinerariifolium]
MSEELKEIYKTLETQFVHEERAINTSFYQDIIEETLEKFNRICFECLLNLDEELCPRFIMEFYKTLRLDRYSEDNRLFVTFDINGHEFNISLDQFVKLTSLPNQVICLYSDAWSLDQLEATLEQVPPYNSNLSSLEDIRYRIHQRVTFKKKPNKE